MLMMVNPHAVLRGGGRLVPVLAILAFALTGTLHAAPFQDLDFEQASVVWDPAPNVAEAAAAFPGWTVMEDGVPQTAVAAGAFPLDATYVGLVAAALSGDPIGGNFSVEISSYRGAPAGYFQNASISQTGDVPADAKTIIFYTRGALIPPVVSLDGTTVDVFPVSTSGGVMVMEGDISAFAGTTSELTFAVPIDEELYELDDISFSPNPIPEPVSAALLLAALPLLAIRRRRV